MTQELMQAWVSGGGTKQLVARNGDFVTMPITLDNAINAPVLRGALLKASAPDQPFVLCDTGAGMPADTDVLALAADDIDLTGAAADVLANAFVSGEFVKETVVAASKATLLAADIVTIQELGMKRGIFLVSSLYGGNSETP